MTEHYLYFSAIYRRGLLISYPDTRKGRREDEPTKKPSVFIKDCRTVVKEGAISCMQIRWSRSTHTEWVMENLILSGCKIPSIQVRWLKN